MCQCQGNGRALNASIWWRMNGSPFMTIVKKSIGSGSDIRTLWLSAANNYPPPVKKRNRRTFAPRRGIAGRVGSPFPRGFDKAWLGTITDVTLSTSNSVKCPRSLCIAPLRLSLNPGSSLRHTRTPVEERRGISSNSRSMPQPTLDQWDEYLLTRGGDLPVDPGSPGMGICQIGWLAHREIWHACRGMNERMHHWGWTDAELMLRISQKYDSV